MLLIDENLYKGYILYAIDNILYGDKVFIVPGKKVKLGLFFSRFISVKKLLKKVYKIQRKKKWDI